MYANIFLVFFYDTFLEQHLAKIQNSCNLKFLKAAKISCVNFIYRTSKAAKYKKTGLSCSIYHM